MNRRRRVVLATAAAGLARAGCAWSQAPARLVRISWISSNGFFERALPPRLWACWWPLVHPGCRLSGCIPRAAHRGGPAVPLWGAVNGRQEPQFSGCLG